MKTPLKRSTKAYSTRSDYEVYDTFCFFPPLILNPSILLVVSLSQNLCCESSRDEALALITMQKSQKVT